MATPTPAGAGDAMYKYTDEKGVIHLSNKRLNDRYRPFYYFRLPKNVDREKIMPFVRYYARRHGLDPDLIRCVIKVESNFKAGAVSHKGAQGLMQIMPDTGRALRIEDPSDPALNIEAGVRYLKAMIDKFGDVRLGLAAYNAGPGNVVKYNGVPPFRETRDYVARIMALYGKE